MVSDWPASTVAPQRKPGDSAISAVQFTEQGVADQLIYGTRKIAAAIEQLVGGCNLVRPRCRLRAAHLVDQRGHCRVGLQQFRKHRQQPVAEIADFSFYEIKVEHAQKFSVGAGIGHERDAAGALDGDGLRNGIMGVAAEDDVDAGDARGKLEIDIHAVMRQQHDRIDLVIVAQAIDQLLQFLVADAEFPVRRRALRVCDWHIGKGLPDHGHAITAEFLDDVPDLNTRPDAASNAFASSTRGFLREADALRQELALEQRSRLARSAVSP